MNKLGYILLGVGIFATIIFLILFIINGIAWVSESVLPIAQTISWNLFLLGLIFCIPISFFTKYKRSMGFILYTASYFFGLTLWVWGFTITFITWGVVGILIGLIVVGVGVLPIGMVACVYQGEWAVLFQLIILTIFASVFRYYGTSLINTQAVETTQV